MAKKKSKKQDWEIIEDVSTMGYRDDSPYRNRESIDIYSPNGLIDMSETGMPILANGRYLPPYSGMHQFKPGVVREKRIMEPGGINLITLSPRPTEQDSLNLYNNAIELQKFYDSKKQFYDEPEVSKFEEGLHDYITSGDLKKETLKNKQLSNANRKIIVNNTDPNIEYFSDLIPGAIDPDAPLMRYDSRIKPQHIISYTPLEGTGSELVERDINKEFRDFFKDYNIPKKDYLGLDIIDHGVFSIYYRNKLSPKEVADITRRDNTSAEKISKKYGIDKNKILDFYKTFDDSYYAELEESDRKDLEAWAATNTPGAHTKIPMYDPIAIKPTALLTPEERAIKEERYPSTNKPSIENIDNRSQTLRPKVKPIQIESKKAEPINLGSINPIPFEPGSYFTRERKPQEADRGKMEYFDKKTGRSIGLYANGGRIPKAQIGTLTPGSSIGIDMPTDLEPLTGLDLAFSKQERIPIQGNEELYNTVINNPKRYNFRIVDSRFFNYLPKEETPIQIKSKKPDLLQSQSTTPRKLEFTRERQPGERFSALYTPQGQKYSAIDVNDKSGKLIRTVDPKTGKIAFKHPVTGEEQFEYGGELPEAGSGYKVVKSSERKGKTHKVTGPDGTVKFFGDSKLGQHPKDPARKKAFYARHKKNLAGNPYFRAFARKTWEEGGQLDIYKRPILSKIEEDPNINRSYYDPKLDIIYAGADYAKMTPEQKNKLLAHENYHAYQFKNDKATYLPVKDIPFAKPSMVSTPEIWNSYYNRKPIEVETDIYDFKSVNPSFQFVPEHLIFDKVVDPGQYENPYTMEGEADFYENTGKDFMKNGGSVWEILPQAQGGTKTGYSWSTQQAPSYQPTFQGNYASSQTTGNRALTSKEMQANKIAAEKRVQQQKEAEYEARQARIKESIAAQNQPLSAENIMTQSQSTGDKMSFAMNTPFGNPKDYPVLSGYMEGLDYINPFKFVGDMASGLGAVPYNVQQGNYGQAAMGVAAPLIAGATAGIGTQGTKQFLNNVFNPVAGINFRKGALKKSPEISFEDYKNLNYEDRIKLINTVDETIQKKGNDIISDLKSAEGKKRLINQFKEADPNLSTEELEKLYDSRITSVERSIKGNRARWVKDLKNVKSLSDPPGSLKEAEEYIMSLDMDNYFPYDNAHYSSSSLYNYTDTPTSNTVKNNGYQSIKKKTNRFLDPDPSPGYITLGKGYETSAPTVSHEVGHAIQKGNKMPIDDELRGLIDSAKHKKGNQFKGAIDDIWRRYFSGNKNFEGLDSNLEYFLKGSHGKEPYPFAREIRDLMLENKILNKTYDPITVQNLNKIKSQSKGIGKNDRLLYFIPPWDRAKLATTMNKAPGLLPYVGAGYLGYQGSQGVEEMPIQQFGGKISNWEIVPDSEWEMVDNINQFQKGGKVVSEIWQDVTGTPWSEAKKLGLTKGGYEENLAIRAELLKNPEKFISLVKEYSGKTKTQPAVQQPVQQPITNKYNSFAARSFSQPYFEGDTYQEAAPSPNVQQPLPTYQWSNQQRVSPNLATGDTPVATPRKAAPPKTQRVAITQRLPDLPLITNPIDSPYFQAPIESTKVVPQMIKKGKQDSSIIQSIVDTINKSEFLKDVKDTIRNVKDVEDVKNSLIRGLGKTGLYAPDTEEVEPMKVPTQKPIIQPIAKPTMNSSAVQDTTPTAYYQGKGILDPKTGTEMGRYVNTFSNWKGQEYIPTKNVGEWKKDKTTQYPSSQIAHYLLDVDLTTGYQHRYSKNYIESQKKGESITKGSTLKEQWLPVYEKLPNGNVRMKYKTNKELTKDDKIAAPLRQYKFGDLDWNSDIKSSWNKSSSALTTKTGEETLIIKSGKDMSGYGQFGGGSFVLISKRKNGEVIVRELAGSAQDLKIQAEDLAKMTGQNVNEIVVGYHDVGSWSAKPSSKNKKMGYSNIPKKSKNEFHSYQEDHTGAGLAFPFAYGGLTKSNWEIIK